MRLFIILLSTLSLISCSEDSEDSSVALPTDLTVSVRVDEALDGDITFVAYAKQANFYSFDFGSGEGYVTDDDGKITYTYVNEGGYVVRIRAHTTAADFIQIEQEVDVKILPFNPQGYETPLSYDGYTLVWNDEFQGTALSSDWTHEVGTGSNGWGNNELQYYRSQNTTLKDGYLTIEARKEAVAGSEYTSSRIITEGTQEFKYGRIDIRAVLPEGQGLWPALWMLGANFSTVSWPFCGEIDIMEMIGGAGRENSVFGTLHWDNNGTYQCTCGIDHDYRLSSGTFSDGFHVFSIIWNQDEIQWYVDDEEYVTVTITPDMEEFKEHFFFIFNVAVGGNLPGSPNESTVFPQQMIVDYVRVFQPN